MDDRMYRTELEQRVDWGDRWGLYLDAQAWACRRMGESVTWFTARIDEAELWYWVGNPEQPRSRR